jgi:hypothetical protein
MEENGRRRDRKIGKDPERSLSFGPEQDPVDILHGSILKE